MIKKLNPHLSILIANLFYGANYSIAKKVMPGYLTPQNFVLLRIIGSLFFIFLLQQFFKKEKVEPNDLLRLFFCGFFGVALNQYLFFEGLSVTKPINAALIMMTLPALILGLSVFTRKEKLAYHKIFGILLGLFGAFLVIGGFNFEFNSKTALGDLFIFLNAISTAVYFIIVAPLMKKYHSFTILKYIFLFGLIPIFFYNLNTIQIINFTKFTTTTWLSVLFVVLGVTIIAYLLILNGLNQVNATIVGVYTYTQPILAIFFSWLIDNQYNLTKQKAFAGLFIFTGIYLVSFGQRHFHKKLSLHKKVNL